MLKAIFFDFDGVLFDLEPLHFDAWVQTVANLGKNDPDFLLQKVVGHSDLDVSRYFIRRFELSLSAEELYRAKREVYAEMLSNHTTDASVQQEVLTDLSQHYELAIVSSSHTEEICIVLERHALGHFFRFVVGGDSVAEHKPHPAPYLEALTRSGCHPSEVIAIEDSEVGLLSATAAQLRAIWLSQHCLWPTERQRSFPSCSHFGELSKTVRSI